MKPLFIVSLPHDIITTIITFLIVVSVLVDHTSTHHLIVNAQSFYNCGTLLVNAPFTETCTYNVPTPLTYDLPNGQTVSFGDESYLLAACMPFVERSIDTCVCQVAVNPGASIGPFDLCNSCNIHFISDTEFIASFDCSNLLDGDCVGFYAIDGFCIDNNNNSTIDVVPTPTPFPTIQTNSPVTTNQITPTTPPITPYPNSATTPSPTPLLPVSVVATSNPSPIPFPVPVTTPTMDPAATPMNPVTTTMPISNMTNDGDVNTPINSNASTNNKSSGPNPLIIGVAIGCAGCLVLAVLMALLMFIIRRKHARRTIETNKDTTFNNPHNEFNADPDEMIRPRSYRTTTTGNSDTSAIASLVQPISATIPHQSHNTFTKHTVSNNHPYQIAMVEPNKSTTTSSTPTPPPSYPLNPHLHVKDQCRDVVTTPIVATATTSPTVVPTMAFAVPVGTITHQ